MAARLCAVCTAVLAVIRLFDFHTSNIQRAHTKRLARRIVRLGNPIRRPPEGRSDDGNKTITRTTKRKAFPARKRYFVPAVFSSISFLPRQKRYGRRRHVRNDHDGTNPCKQGFLSSVLVSSFPNRKLNLRFGFFYANL